MDRAERFGSTAHAVAQLLPNDPAEQIQLLTGILAMAIKCAVPPEGTGHMRDSVVRMLDLYLARPLEVSP